MSEKYSGLSSSVALVLAEIDPLGLADPEISLVEEYEAEAREITRRVLASSGGSADLRARIQAVFVQQFDARISDHDLAVIVRAVTKNRPFRDGLP